MSKTEIAILIATILISFAVFAFIDAVLTSMRF